MYETTAELREISSDGVVGLVSAVSAVPTLDYAEYYLGAQGATCDEVCAKLALKCNPAIDMGDADQVLTAAACSGAIDATCTLRFHPFPPVPSSYTLIIIILLLLLIIIILILILIILHMIVSHLK
jgi:hypothetical protein